MATRQEVQGGVDSYSLRRTTRHKPYKLSVPRPATPQPSRDEPNYDDDPISSSDLEKENDTTKVDAPSRPGRGRPTKVKTSVRQSKQAKSQELDDEDNTTRDVKPSSKTAAAASSGADMDMFGDSMGVNGDARRKKRKLERSYSTQSKTEEDSKTGNINVKPGHDSGKGTDNKRKPSSSGFKQAPQSSSRPVKASPKYKKSVVRTLPQKSSSKPQEFKQPPKPAPPKSGFRVPTFLDPSSTASADITAQSMESSQVTPPSSPLLEPTPPPVDSQTQEGDDSPFDGDDVAIESSQIECPMCGQTVDRDFYLEFTKGRAKDRLNITQQSRFCRRHKINDANREWTSRGYPTISWESLEERMSMHMPYLRRVLKKEQPSFFRQKLADVAARQKERTLAQAVDKDNASHLTPGYYGTRGANIMNQFVISNIAKDLRMQAKKDKLIGFGGVSAFVQTVLVPELATLLIMEDMQASEEEARDILSESVEIGDLINDDESDRRESWRRDDILVEDSGHEG